MKIRTILEHVYKVIEPRKRWIKHNFALDKSGEPVLSCDKHAVCYCLDGALQKVCGGGYGNIDYAKVSQFLDAFSEEVHGLDTCGNYIGYVSFNDDDKTTKKDVLTFVKKAIGRAKRTGK